MEQLWDINVINEVKVIDEEAESAAEEGGCCVKGGASPRLLKKTHSRVVFNFAGGA